MTREQLEHLVRAAAYIADDEELIIVGSQAVDETTATLPEGWKDRLVPVKNANTRGATGWCLEVHDLVISKLVAAREKDLEFAREAPLTASLARRS